MTGQDYWPPYSNRYPGHSAARETKRRLVTNILEWVQCYSIYVAEMTTKHPQDLMRYQALIVEACMEYGSDSLLGYDRRFCQTAAASPDMVWAKIDPTLWNMAITGQAKSSRCKFCSSLTHPWDIDVHVLQLQ